MASIDEHLEFLKQFLKLGLDISAPCMSPRALAEAACVKVDSTKIQTIVELGAGTGAITQIILEKMHPESTLLSMEINSKLGRFLKQYHNQAHIVIGDVQKIEEVFCNLKLDKVDLIISSLPFRSLPPTSIQAILNFFHNYARDSETTFCQLTIVPFLFRKLYRRIFKSLQPISVWKCIPPGEIYICSGVRQSHLSTDS